MSCNRLEPKTVYFIRPVGSLGPVKIGCSRSPDGRQKTLETWSPYALKIVATIAGHHELEHRFHARFAHLHERREWFRWEPELQDVIDAINAGAFDIGTLPAPLCIQDRVSGQRRRRTDEQRWRFSYSQRLWRMRDRSGCYCRWNAYDLTPDNAEAIAAIEAYLADPLTHGEPVLSPRAEAARKAFREAQSEARAA